MENIISKIKTFLIGAAKNPLDQSVFRNLSLVAFFAWVGLGADGISSSCYGPAEAFLALGKYHYLGLLIALATAFTIFIISSSYSQIIELFPTGGGGYLVASKLLSPTVGMISGSALLVDYILTISISIASGADALFSFLPASWYGFKFWFAVFILLLLIVLNLRGVKESVLVLMPIFLTFIITHVFIILYALLSHFMDFSSVIQATTLDIKTSTAQLGVLGMLFLLMRAYSMGAGTYTGIEAVCNGLPILREPKVKTAKQTMKYMVISLATIVLGLMFAYAFFKIEPQTGKTLNAVLFNKIAGNWGLIGALFVFITLISETAILFVAAQTGFIDGPRVLANMARDRWIPKRFVLLSDRLVTMNGILIMGLGSLALMIMTRGSVGFLVVLYSINVFIDFCLSQTGMVRYWLRESKEGLKKRLSKLTINGIGLILTTFILLSIIIIKFHEGGWITLLITGSLIIFLLFIKKNYELTDKYIGKVDKIIDEIETSYPAFPICPNKLGKFNPKGKTAVVFVKDYTGVGLKTIKSLFKSFGSIFDNFVFVQIGLIDAGAFKDYSEIEKVKEKAKSAVDRYVDLMKRYGYHSEGFCSFGIDTVEELVHISKKVLKNYPNCAFFGGQTVFPDSFIFSRLLHNYTLFSIQERLYKEGIPLFVLPIEVPLS